MHKSREGLEEEEGRLQFGALQKEGTADVLAQLGRSRGGSPGIGGWQRPPRPEPSSPQLPGRGVGSRCGEKICKRAGMNLDQAGRSPHLPDPTAATARWLCPAEGPRCGRGRGARWSSSPPLFFQPWQADWGARAGDPAKTPRWEVSGTERCLQVRSAGSRSPLLKPGHRKPNAAGCWSPFQPQSWGSDGEVGSGRSLPTRLGSVTGQTDDAAVPAARTTVPDVWVPAAAAAAQAGLGHAPWLQATPLPAPVNISLCQFQPPDAQRACARRGARSRRLR